MAVTVVATVESARPEAAASGSPAGFTAVIRGVLGNSEVVDRIRVLIVNGLVLPMVARVAPDQAELRAHLVASQLVGLGMARWVVRLEAVHDASPEELADAVGPTIQRYLTGDISG